MKRAEPANLSARSENVALPSRNNAGVAEAGRPSLLDDERGNRVVLPADHPQWRRDHISLSNRAATLLTKIKPFVIRVLAFWDHRTTSLPLDDVRLDVDPSGSYRAT
jgi:hypothetical protein